MHERSSLFDVTIQSILYLTGTDTRRCLPRHVARAESEGVGDTIPLVTPRRLPDYAQIWCVFGHQLPVSFTQCRSGVNLHVRKCTPLFHISQTAARIALKFCM